MAQSLSAVYVHIIFSTKDRRPIFVDPAFRAELHSYLGGTCNHLGCKSLIVGGVEDHVHILAKQSRTLALSDWMRELKSNSSTWVKGREAGFAWQAGYGAFSVDPTRVEVVRAYILGQEAHHRRVTFQDEFRAILKEYDLEGDERYLWD